MFFYDTPTAMSHYEFSQTIFVENFPPISVTSIHEDALKRTILNNFLESIVDGRIGVAPAFGRQRVLSEIALSSSSQVLVVRLSKGRSNQPAPIGRKNPPKKGRDLLRSAIFCHPSRRKYAFKMDKFAAALLLDLGYHLTLGIDLLSASNRDRDSLDAILDILGGEKKLHKRAVRAEFEEKEDIALRAWTACRAATLLSMGPRLKTISPIDTTIDEPVLGVLAKISRDRDRLSALKPTRVENEVNAFFAQKSGTLEVKSNRFKNRIQHDATQTVEVQAMVGGKSKTYIGRVKNVQGRVAKIGLNSRFEGATIRSIHTIGKGSSIYSEKLLESIILECLQRTINIVDLPFVGPIWFPVETSCPRRQRLKTQVSSRPFLESLNRSQKEAVEAIVSDEPTDNLVLVHGPPGTGKTTVITRATLWKVALAGSNTMWLIAHSNLAVKNIAEKLATSNFLDFKLLVSHVFHFDWHEHLYAKISRNVITSNEITEDACDVAAILAGSRVILCTLCMLSNPRISEIARQVPVETVVVDEASQIEVGEYIPMLYTFQRTLRKLVFIGDDKQLAPYGQEDLHDLHSIFEMSHLRGRAIFLDTQYRMPVPLGSFISKYVYDNKLHTQHKITSLKSCLFIDCEKGEEKRLGNGFVNMHEVRVIVNLARNYTSKHRSFRIITPYDAQRAAIVKALKDSKIPWEDKCFNVDSFQGNEDDYILISLVRTQKMGFLKEKRRTNVMLTRCKKSMVICTNRMFLDGIGSSSLVASLAQQLGAQAWIKSSNALHHCSNL